MRYRIGSRVSSSSACLSLESSCFDYSITMITMKLNSRYQFKAFAAAQSIQITRCNNCSSFCRKDDLHFNSINLFNRHSLNSFNQSTFNLSTQFIHSIHSVYQHSVHSLSSFTQFTQLFNTQFTHSVNI